MNQIKRIFSLLMSMVLVITSSISVFAGTSMDTALNKVNLYVKQDKGGQLLTWKGVIDAENFAPAIIVYRTADGQELPAFCANPNKPGVEDLAAKAYDVDVDQLDTDPHVWAVITNGYPYKTPAELGLKTDYEAYYATKMAVWAIVHDNYSNLDDWKANGEQNAAVEKAMKDLVAKGRANSFVYTAWLATNPVTATAKDTGEFLVQEFNIKSNVNVEGFQVVLDGDVPAGTKVVDENGQEKDKYDGSTTNIKVMIPKTGEKREGTFRIILKATLENKAVMFGQSHENKQDYYVAPLQSYNGDSWADVTYKENPGTIPDEKPDNPDPPAASKGLQILKVRKETTQPLAGAVFKIVKTNGGVLGHYVTDAKGEISIPDIPIGEYYIEEEVPPLGHVLDENSHKDVVVTADEPTIVTFSNEEMAELEILKVDADTGEQLAGAAIRIALDGGQDSFDVYTNASGRATLTNLKSGTYTVTEISAPDGYILNETPQSIKLEAGKSATITLKNKAKPGLIVKKYDEETGMPLPNAEFSIAKKGGSIIYEGMTDKEGKIKLDGLDEGWYTITEIAAPKGYLLATESKDVYLEPNKAVEVKFDNRLRPSLQIMKIDAQTGEALKGAKFKITKTEDMTVSEYITDDTGTIVIHDLDEAVYTVEEIQAPEGYRIDPDSHKDIALEWGKTKTLVFSDTKNPVLEIQKIDAQTKEPLAGAKFRITKTEDKTVSEHVTKADGKIVLENLSEGLYTIEEIEAPDGYRLDPEIHKDIALEAGKTKTLVFSNTKNPVLEIQKIDAQTKEPLAGAKFRITKTEDKTVSEHVTKADGKIVLENLSEGLYTIEEIEAPDGYRLDPEIHKDIALEAGKTKTLVFSNTKNPVLEIQKIDAQTKEPLAGAKFRITKTEDKTVSEHVTKADGKIVLENLSEGLYTIEEIEAPNGYRLDPENHKDIALEAGKTKTLVFSNTKNPVLEIQKIDAQTKEPLAGAKFRITKTEDKTVSEHVTKADGKIVLENLSEGLYTIEEIEAPNGYRLDPEIHKDIALEAGKTKTLVFPNTKNPVLEIQKIDSQTKEPLAGAKFRITKTEDKTVSEHVTKADGKIVLENLSEGLYTIEEIEAPDGYRLDPENHKDIALEAGKTKTLVFSNTKNPVLEIQKIDSQTKKPLAGAKFKVTRTEDNTVSEYLTDANGKIVIKNLEEGIYTVEELTAPTGYILDVQHKEIELEAGKVKTLIYENTKKPTLILTKTNVLTEKPVPNTVFKIQRETENGGITTLGTYKTDKNGQIILKNVEPGWYIITEIRAAQGMSLPSNPVTRKYLTPGENAYSDDFKDAETTTPENANGGGAPDNTLPSGEVIVTSGNDYKNIGEEIPNYPLNSIVIKKVDANTSELLAGAAFEVRQVAGDISGGSGTIIGRYTTDNSGIIVITGLEAGAYVVEEVQPPQNYLLSENSKQQAWLKADGTSVVELTFANYPYGSILVTKVDAKTNKPLSNARFKVTTGDGTAAGNTNGEFVTNSNGEILVPNLKPGSYVITELEALEGYALDTTPQTIEVGTDGGTYKVSFQNQPESALVIIKKDSSNKAPLSGAKFKVTTAKGDAVGTGNGIYTTDGNGTITIPGLGKGSYVIEEIKAPEGYVLENQARTIAIDYGKIYTEEFLNKPMASLIIHKFDSKDKKPLPGAEFTISKKSGEVVGKYITNSSGIIQIDELEPGWYSAVETKAPNGYLLNDVAQDFEIKHTKTVTLEFTNELLTALVIKKIDAKTGEPLSGAKFRIEEQDGTYVGEYTSDSDGTIHIPQLSPGWFVIRETKAPAGYQLDETPKTVEVKTQTPTVVTFENELLTSIVIKKIDAKTGEPLSGAKFEIERQNGEHVGEYTSGSDGAVNVSQLAPDWYIIKETKAPAGYQLDETPKTVEVKTQTPTVVTFENELLTSIVIKKIDAKTGEPLSGAKFEIERQNGEHVGEYTSGSDGVVNVSQLAPDWYIIKETKAPAGYQLDETPKTVEVKTQTPTVVTFENELLTSIVIKKIDAKTGEPLSGAKFEIERQNGEHVGEYTSGSDGVVNVSQLAPDWYVIKEIKAPEGYLLDETPKTVEVKTQTPTVVTFENQLLAALQIRKVDAVTGVPLAGAKFKVMKQNGEVIGEYTTEKDGFVNVPELAPGYYSVSEMKAPEGYILDESPKTVEVKTNKPTSVVFENKPLAGIKIIKTDSESGEPLEGVAFSISKLNGEKIGTFKTDKEGMVYVSNLEDGYYAITEIEGLEGYHWDQSPATVEVKSGKLTIHEVKNEPYSLLVIKKTSSRNGEPIEGVEFLVTKENGEEIGYYETDSSGRIEVEGLEDGVYLVKEIKAAKGFQLDSKAREVEIRDGKRAVVKIENDPLSSVLIRKIDSVTGKGIEGVTFLLYDGDNEPIGQFVSDNEGYVWLRKELPEGKYKLRELEPAEGYLSDDEVKTFYVQNGRTTEIIWENTPEVGQIVVTKRSSEFNELTGLPAGSPLAGAVFEVYNTTGNLVDKMTSDSRGIAASKGLPIGVYTLKEVSAPRYYAINDRTLMAEIRHNGDIVRFELLNSSISLNLTVQKKGPNQSSPGQTMNYEIYGVTNESSGKLEDFYIHDRIPTDATRVVKVTTGTYSERMYYKIEYKTNYRDYMTLADNLLTKNDYEYSLHPNALGLQNGEYVTDVRLVFPQASPGFRQTKSMHVLCQVLPSVPKDYNITNRADVGGRYGNEWESAKTSWNTTVWAAETPAVKLPKTGY